MSARLPADPAGREVLAAEYVLGTLDARTTATVTEALASDAALRQAVEAWEDQFTPLAGAVPQALPPDDLWNRIAARLPEQRRAAPMRAAATAAPSLSWLWRAWAIGASVAAAVFAGIAYIETAQPARQEATALPAAPAAPAAASPAAVPESRLASQPTPATPAGAQVRSVATDPSAGPAKVKPAAAEGPAPIVASPAPSAPAATAFGPVIRPAAGDDAAAPVLRPSSGETTGKITR